MIQIRLATDDERESSDFIDQLTLLLHRAYAELGEQGLMYTGVDQTTQETRRRIEYADCFVATRGGILVGTITVRGPYFGSPCPYLELPHVATAYQLAVDPQAQGRWLSAALFNATEAWAVAMGYSELAGITASQARRQVKLHQRRQYREVARLYWPGQNFESIVFAKTLQKSP